MRPGPAARPRQSGRGLSRAEVTGDIPEPFDVPDAFAWLDLEPVPDADSTDGYVTARTRPRPAKDSERFGRGKRTPNLFNPVMLGFTEYRRELSLQIERLARQIPRGKTRKELLKRAHRLSGCGATMHTFKCGSCGELAPGHGELEFPTDTEGRVMPGRTRGCPCCGRFRSRSLAKKLQAALERADLTKDIVTFWTFTMAYDPKSEDDLTVDALRARAGDGFHAVQRLWNRVFKPRGCKGMAASLELGSSGLVHIHAIIVGPFVPKTLVEKVGRQFYDRFGHTFVNAVDTSRKGAIAREAAKYTVKSPGPKAEGWLGGEKRPCMDPALAARWEVATLHMRLYRGYGLFRALKEDEPDESPSKPTEAEPDDAEETSERGDPSERLTSIPDPPMTRTESIARLQCPCCGAIGNWRDAYVNTEAAVRALHARRLPTLWGSRWEPDPDDW